MQYACAGQNCDFDQNGGSHRPYCLWVIIHVCDPHFDPHSAEDTGPYNDEYEIRRVMGDEHDHKDHFSPT